MKLKKISVSGFKSFVDSTEVSFNTQIAGVVGPNGCGKSNVIDAVRWVMGESSAKMLRGDSMDDVIFNGSSARKPVGRASVELIFDNSLGRIKSHYKQFAEIAIKRILNRDGVSEYRINDKRVRRKDVLDLFRGTGLGPRSYSIIEQGMVSRIVEAKPEELRAYVEEAAGITKYKDRRRETENRIRHTRENIERSEDIRSELLAQLRRLKRQAQAAERYKKLQGKRRAKMALLYRLRYDGYSEAITAEQNRLDEASNSLEKQLSEQRSIEADIERKRSEHDEAQDKLGTIQASFYQAGADISKLEQQIEHIKVTREEDATALAEVNEALTELDTQTRADEEALVSYQKQLTDLQPGLASSERELSEAVNTYEQAREDFNAWQNQFNQQRQQRESRANQKQLQLSIIDQINRQQHRAKTRHEQLSEEEARLQAELEQSGATPLTEALKSHQANFDQLQVQIDKAEQTLREHSQAGSSLQNQLNEQRSLSQTTDSRIQSLREFQAAALDSGHQEYRDWLSQAGLANSTQLAPSIKIEKGWERAADVILAPYLQGLIDQNGQHPFWLKNAEHAVTLISSDRIRTAPRDIGLQALSALIESSQVSLDTLLAGVYVAEDAATAQSKRLALVHGERIVTKEGVVYGANWVSHSGAAASNTGYLVREEEMQSLSARKAEIEQTIERIEQDLFKATEAQQQTGEKLKSLRSEQEGLRGKITDSQREIARVNTAQEYTQSRLSSIQQELDEISSHGHEEQKRLDEARQTLESVEAVLQKSEIDHATIAEREQEVKSAVEKSNLSYREKQDHLQGQRLEQTRLETSIGSLENALERMRQQIAQYKARKENLLSKSQNGAVPLDGLAEALDAKLAEHKEIETRLLAARDEISGIDNSLREQQSALSQCIQAVNEARELLSRIKMERQARQVRQQSLLEEASRDGCDVAEVELPEAPQSIESVEQELETIQRKITGIGAVNLVAIDEYESQSERAEYLERQHKDLEDALTTLEKVIRKIDKETRQRFEETYTQLEKSFSSYFPKLFGGGRASLNLTSDDWLTTGVTVIAQPPGKRNSTIHLLSGGEKALTAVSLLFALFELNPAPFCMMDEVDAPLDDANVDRFCDTLKSLSEHAQIIVITHNKITMQAASSLIGVTMNEPGVSRVVSVDVDQALEMVDA